MYRLLSLFTLLLAPAFALAQPQPSPQDAEITKLATPAKEKGFTVKRSPMFDRLVAMQQHKLQSLSAAGTPVTPETAFQISAQQLLGCIPPAPGKKLPVGLKLLPKATATQFDCRTQGWVPPVRDQGNCGSCWDFSGTGTIECSYLKLTGASPASVDLSEEAILACANSGGCNGDWPETVFAFAKTKGMALEKDLPYQQRRVSCPSGLAFPVKVSDYAYIGTDSAVADTQAIKDAMQAYGPISCAVAVDNAFAAYSSGVFSGGARGINHAIILVGWDDTDGCWILRNSWNTSWGESGYMRIKYGSNQVGYGAMWCKAAGDPAPVTPITLSVSPATGAAPLSVIFATTGTNTAWSLDFGDTTTPATGTTVTTVAHSYNIAGTYTATLTCGTQKATAAVVVSAVVPPGPNPGPSPTPSTFTGTITTTIVTTYANGVKGSTTETISVQATAGRIQDELKAAGVSPTIVTDVMQLLTDLRAKAATKDIMADVIKILMDLGTSAPHSPAPKEEDAVQPKCCGQTQVEPVPPQIALAV